MYKERLPFVLRGLCFPVAVLFALQGDAQITWRRTYGGFGSDNALSVRQTDDGGYVIAGATGSFGNGSSDIYVVRTDDVGEHIWSRYYGGVGADVGVACRELADGYIIAGTTATGSMGGYDMVLIRTDEQGDPLWQRNYGSVDWDFCNAFTVVDDGFLMAGMSYGPETPLGCGTTLKTDLNGELQWTYSLAADEHSEFLGVYKTADGGVALSGRVVGADGNENGVLARLDAQGGEQWLTVLGGDSADRFSSAVEAVNGDLVVCGSTRSGVDHQNIHLVAFDPDGAFMWERLIGNTADCGGREIRRAQGSGYVFTGFNSLNGGAPDMILTVTDGGGWFQYGNNYGDGAPADGYSIDPTSDGGYVLAGWCENYGPGPRAVYVVKTDGNGQTADLSVETYADPVGISESTHRNEQALFPNPAGSGETLTIPPVAARPVRFVLSDAQGRVVMDERIQTTTVRIAVLEPGMYYATVSTVDGVRTSMPLLIR